MTDQLNWLKSHWQVLALLVALVSWGVRLEGKADSHLTKWEAMQDKAEVVLTIETRLSSMSEDITTIKEDVAYLRGQSEVQR